jgi:hypothetical protein
MPSIAISPFPEHESGIKTIFNHFRNTHARYEAAGFDEACELVHVLCQHLFNVGIFSEWEMT